jgi:hypothetical protein
VQQSSESVGALAASLAKAQAQLTNPEKSLTAVIRTGSAGGTERSFRYAPLSSGLDIVRKALGEHEIAVIQTTAIDQTTRILNLTTVLAHSSGQWISSQWPVCPISEINNPHRMGAALTYARRYGLFTLVGIAGEDDLDAPDLCAPTSGTNPPTVAARTSSSQGVGSRNGRVRGVQRPVLPPVLSTDKSATLRAQLLAEITDLHSHDAATIWAGQALARKNTLTTEDAKLLEVAFVTRLSELPVSDAAQLLGESSSGSAAGDSAAKPEVETSNELELPQGAGIDKSVLTLSTPRRYRNKEHLRFITKQPCILCGRKPSDSHHLKFLQPRALGRKPSDEYAVPLCRTHHRALHRAGDEQVWWQSVGVDPVKVARKLWQKTCANGGQGRQPTVAEQAAQPNLSIESNGTVSKEP